jgi:hypothetical protein
MFLTFTVAPDTTAPVESVTVPDSWPVSTWADKLFANRRVNAMAAIRKTFRECFIDLSPVRTPVEGRSRFLGFLFEPRREGAHRHTRRA